MSAVRPPEGAMTPLEGSDPRAAGERGGATVTVLVNGVAQTTAAQTLAQWIETQGLAANALATAVNGQFVPRTLREQHSLADGDTIVTFQPIEGG